MGRDSNKPESPKPLEADGARRFTRQDLAAHANARWTLGSHGSGRDAGSRGYLYRLRTKLGECFQHAIPRIQTLGPRRRNQHATDRALARKACRQSRFGKLENQPGHLIDIMATCVDVAGARYPNEIDGKRSNRWKACRCSRHLTENHLNAEAANFLGARKQPRRSRWQMEARRQSRPAVGTLRHGKGPHRNARSRRKDSEEG